MNRKLKLVLALGGVLVVVAVAAGLYRTDADKTVPGPDAEPASVRVMELAAGDVGEVTLGSVEVSVPLSGSLRPFEQTVVKTKIPGELIAVTVREGETVRKGQVLARLDDTEARARLAERTALLEVARAQLDLARKNWDMNQQLLAKNFISQNAADNVASSAAVQEANLRAAAAQLDLARKALADAVVTSPINGVVSQRHAQPGEKLPVDARLLSIVDLSRMELEAEVPSSRIAAVKPGSRVGFRIEGIEGRDFSGTVDRINPSADGSSRMIAVYVLIDNAGRTLRGGMFAKGSLAAGREDDVLLLPLSAVREEAGREVVYALQDDVVQRMPVRIGTRDTERNVVRLIEGPPAGTRVVNANLSNVQPGDRVTVAASPSP